MVMTEMNYLNHVDAINMFYTYCSKLSHIWLIVNIRQPPNPLLPGYMYFISMHFEKTQLIKNELKDLSWV